MKKTNKQTSRRYFYFVSYNYGNGFGSCEIFTDAEIDRYETLNEIRDLISDKEQIEKSMIIILNFIFLRQETVQL